MDLVCKVTFGNINCFPSETTFWNSNEETDSENWFY